MRHWALAAIIAWVVLFILRYVYGRMLDSLSYFDLMQGNFFKSWPARIRYTALAVVICFIAAIVLTVIAIVVR